MATREDLIVQAIVARIVATGIVGSQVFESRSNALSSVQIGQGAVHVFPADTDPAESALGHTRHDFRVRIDVFAAEATPAPPAPAVPANRVADPIVDAVHKAVLADRTLGGLAARIVPGRRSWLFDGTDRTYVVVEQTFSITHATSSGDLTQPA